MAATRRIDPELASWARGAFKPARLSGDPRALRSVALNRERAAIVDAIKSSRNLNAAADKLDVSRKTLFNRMREYGLPEGRSGRPRTALPHGSSGVDIALGVVAIAGLAGIVYAWWRSGRPTTTTAQSRPSGLNVLGGLSGLDAIVTPRAYVAGTDVLAAFARRS